ncbi:MAG: TIGR01777 family protein [Pirellulaceae bacterium]|nr:TIGR01777 family protein [Pirellulaceae bacterium]
MKIAITGSTGLIGSALANRLLAAGHELIRLVRDPQQATDAGHCWWDPQSGIKQPEKLDGIEAVVHLAGRGIADHRWTSAEKQLIRSSRIDATERLSRGLAALSNPPPLFVSASAVGIYGDCQEESVTEQHAPGDDFLATTAVDWEAASASLVTIGTQVVHTRFGVVLTTKGGALAKMLPLFRWGLGGNLGHGRQYWSWITLEDTVSAIVWLLERYAIAATTNQAEAYNLVSPQPVTNAQFTRELAQAVGRTRFLSVPAFALRLMVGEMADAALLASCRAEPARLLAEGFTFESRTLDVALKNCLHPR